MKRLLWVLPVLAILCTGCGKEKRSADLKGIEFDVKLGRFDKAFWELDTLNLPQSIAQLDSAFPEMTDIYLERVVQFGNKDSVQTQQTIRYFLADTTVAKLYLAALEKFSDVSVYEQQLTDAFRRAHYFFPEKTTPNLYMHLSGFNQSVIVGNDFISLSADNYMGTDFPLYSDANIYQYQRLNMRPEKIVSDYVSAFLLSEYPYVPVTGNLLEEIIYRGKIVYLTSVLLPKESEAVIMGYTPEQMEWSKENERNMWLTMVESKDLFTTQMIQKGRYLNDGPFTLPFTQNSPARGGVYIGWQIIESYMKKHSDVTPLQLIENTNAQVILEQSGYNP